MTTEWSKEWPTAPGYYWFWGYPYEHFFSREPELNFVEVRKISNGNMVTRSGAFWFRSEWPGVGFFLPLAPPTVPELPELNKS